MSVKILAFAGSVRKESFNAQLAKIAAEGVQSAGGSPTVVNLADFALPLFDEDLESQGTPEGATRLKQLFIEHDALLIASPEYNSSLTPLLKNAIDWVSRAAEGEAPLAAYKDKVAAIVAASPGALGGMRGLVHLRAILSNLGVIVLPTQVTVPKAFNAFADGKLQDVRMQDRVWKLATELTNVTQSLKKG